MASETFLHMYRHIREGLSRFSRCLLGLALLIQSGLLLAVSQDQINTSSGKIKQYQSSISSSQSRVNTLEKRLQNLDQSLLEERKSVRDERTANRKLVYEARRDLKRQTFEIEKIEKEISLVEFDIEIAQRDMLREQQRFASMNVLKQRLEENDHQQRISSLQNQIEQLQQKKLPLQAELDNANNTLAQLQQELDSQQEEISDAALDSDPRVAALNKQRSNTAAELERERSRLQSQRNALSTEQKKFNTLVNQFKQETGREDSVVTSEAKPATAVGITTKPRYDLGLNTADYTSYVFVVSGAQEPNIESTLHLKSWVESYGAKYIEATWNGFKNAPEALKDAGFQAGFQEYLAQIPREAKVILIGHGLGGGAAIDAATRIAHAQGRSIEFLVALDPIGPGGLRANIVYDTQGKCGRPSTDNRNSNAEYIACLRASNKRMITSNIKYFYNRWQKDAEGPLDYQRMITSVDANGNNIEVPTASGRFNIENGTQADQRRLFFAGDSSAHKLLLAEEAKLLPKLLVQHLR